MSNLGRCFPWTIRLKMQISPLYQKVHWVCGRTLEKWKQQLSVCLGLGIFARSLNFFDAETPLRNSGTGEGLWNTACAHCSFIFVAKLIRRRSCKGNPDKAGQDSKAFYHKQESGFWCVPWSFRCLLWMTQTLGKIVKAHVQMIFR